MAVKSAYRPGKSPWLIAKIKDQLLELENLNKILKLVWIPGHQGISGNEKVDKLAKEAVEKGRDSHIGVSKQDFKSYWKEKMYIEFFDWCKETGKNRGVFYFNNYLSEKRKRWFHSLNLDQRVIVSLNRLRSGHTSLKESLSKLNIVNSATCDCGLAEESANHVFWQCIRFQKEHKYLRKCVSNICGTLPCPVESLLTFYNERIIFTLSKFIKDIDIFI